MKRLFTCLLLAAALVTNACALEVPTDTTIQNLNGSQQFIKTYTLPPGADPQQLIEEPFEQEGWCYTFADIVKEENQVSDRKYHTETVTLETDTKDLGKILEQLSTTLDYDDGTYSGVLNLDHTAIRTEAAGYISQAKNVTATKTIGPLDRNDMSYVPATTVKDGVTLNLSNVDWQVIGTDLVGDTLSPASYQAVATYSGKSYHKVATGYVTSADYTGEITWSDVESVTHKVTYLGTESENSGLAIDRGDINAAVLPGKILPYALGVLGGGQSLSLRCCCSATVGPCGSSRRNRRTNLNTRRKQREKMEHSDSGDPARAGSAGTGPLRLRGGGLLLRNHRPQDYYKSTSYEDVYGSQYNYGGRNVVDYQIPEFEYSVQSTTMTDVMERTILPGLQQSVTTGGGGYGVADSGPITVLVEANKPGSAGSQTPVTPTLPTYQSPAYTSADGMAYKDGSIGNIKIPSLKISMKLWEGETDASMRKGLGHYSSTSAWDGNVGVCGHNRGTKYAIGSIKNLKQGDTITYTTIYGTRTYAVETVKIISNTDWSYLQATSDNRLTLTTCLADHPESRVVVQAVEVRS